MGSHYYSRLLVVGALLLLGFVFPSSSSSSSTTTRRFDFNIEWKNVTRLCNMKRLLTVNGEYPGPTITVNEGDNVEVKVTNLAGRNTTIHWHGIRQMRTGWADGPAYITQCPVAAGSSYTYKFTVTGQRGTLWWHAHLGWQRVSVYGAFIIYPRIPYPFATPIHAEIPIILGEWWNIELDEMEMSIKYGQSTNLSDAHTINGFPGSLYPCSTQDTFTQTVERGQTYMLRIINAGLTYELFFSIANHELTVVEIDAAYTKPFKTNAVMITPGQTTTVLLTADQLPDSNGLFVMAARPYLPAEVPFNITTTIGFLKYGSTEMGKFKLPSPTNIRLPYNLPLIKDTASETKYSDNLRSLASVEYPCNVPKTIDKQVITTISLNLQDCPVNHTCKGYHGKSFMASMNNQSFLRPERSILECLYHNYSSYGLYSSDFPEKPPHVFNFTGVDPLTENMNTEIGTKLLVVPYGTKLEIVLQDTGFIGMESHPIHIHGHNFFIVGRGFGNFNAESDPARYNLVDPPERNTVTVPAGGWAAVRMIADNPGVWFIHCHLEQHTVWGLAMGLIVKSGTCPSQCLLPPPSDLPSC